MTPFPFLCYFTCACGDPVGDTCLWTREELCSDDLDDYTSSLPFLASKGEAELCLHIVGVMGAARSCGSKLDSCDSPLTSLTLGT